MALTEKNGSTKSNPNFKKRTQPLLFHICWMEIKSFPKATPFAYIFATEQIEKIFLEEMPMNKSPYIQLSVFLRTCIPTMWRMSIEPMEWDPLMKV